MVDIGDGSGMPRKPFAQTKAFVFSLLFALAVTMGFIMYLFLQTGWKMSSAHVQGYRKVIEACSAVQGAIPSDVEATCIQARSQLQYDNAQMLTLVRLCDMSKQQPSDYCADIAKTAARREAKAKEGRAFRGDD